VRALSARPGNTSPKDLADDGDKIAKIQRDVPQGLVDKILSQDDKIKGERRQATGLAGQSLAPAKRLLEVVRPRTVN
jgi:hypothetical protein